jgi:hypothetical protein
MIEQSKVTFWDRGGWYWVIMRQINGQTGWLFGTGEVDFVS